MEMDGGNIMNEETTKYWVFALILLVVCFISFTIGHNINETNTVTITDDDSWQDLNLIKDYMYPFSENDTVSIYYNATKDYLYLQHLERKCPTCSISTDLYRFLIDEEGNILQVEEFH